MFGYDSVCLYKDGKPWFPFMGEIHYSRLPADEWRDSLLRMKAGGVDVVASYTFWIHHEEVKGEWEFGGCRDLRRFAETVKDCGLYMFLRIGPWSHGEARNGGFPDWLLRQGFKPRTNDEKYLRYVEMFYAKLYEQVSGLLHKDGGPIIGVQIENEYGHCGGMWGEDGEEHMRKLTAAAKKAGFDVPIYTATGWNGAVTGGLLPVMGGYVDAPWDRGIQRLKPNGNFVFTHERNDTSIGSDIGLGAALTYDMGKFPFITAELGGGLQVTKHRRPIPSAADIAAMSVVKMGSGCNLLGYYMYHGGVNPSHKLTPLQETLESGGYNDLPELSYHFQASLGAYGQYSDKYHELRLLAMFVADFGGDLCRMKPYIPADNPLDPADAERFRYSFRHNGEWGFVFFNNHVRHMARPRFNAVKLTVPEMGLELPAFNVKPGEFGFYPFNMPTADGTVKFAEAAPLCKINGTTVFYGTDMDAADDVLLITRHEALHAYKIKDDMERLVISTSPLVQDKGKLRIFADYYVALKVYPAWDVAPQGFQYHGNDKKFGLYNKTLDFDKPDCAVDMIAENRYRLRFTGFVDDAYDYECHIKYTAESAKAFVGGEMVMDDYYTDGHWQINLRRHGFPEEIVVELNPLRADERVYLEARPVTGADGSVCRLDGAEVRVIREVAVDLRSS